MKKLLLVLTVPAALVLVLALAGVGGGCGLLDSSSGIDIDLPDQSFPFSLDVSQVKSQLISACQTQCPSCPCSSMTTEIPSGVNITQTFSVDIPAQNVDLSTQQQIKKYVDAGKIKAVTVKYVKYTLSQNTLNFDSPVAELWMAALNATSITDPSAAKIGQIPSIAAGSTTPGEVQFVEGGRQTLSTFLLGLKFALLGKADIYIDTSKTRTIPTGSLVGEVTIGLRFTVDPL